MCWRNGAKNFVVKVVRKERYGQKDNRKCVPIQKLRLKLDSRGLNTGDVKRRGDQGSTTLFWQKGPPLQ